MHAAENYTSTIDKALFVTSLEVSNYYANSLSPLKTNKYCKDYYYSKNTATTTRGMLQPLLLFNEYCYHNNFYSTNIAVTISTPRILQSLLLLHECCNHYHYSTNVAITITTPGMFQSL